MPEGPSILIMKEEASIFEEKKIIGVSGNSKIDQSRLLNKTPHFKTWGKHFLICFDDFFVRIHLLMFGKYMINERKENVVPRLSLQFKKGEFNFYSCAASLTEGNADDVYDWEVDTLSDSWNEKKALSSLKKKKDDMVCDLLLDQSIFAGSGNIVKNEVLFRTRIHPETNAGDLTEKKRKELVKEVRLYCEDFYEWKKAFVLSQHWEAYRQKECPRCNLKFTLRHLGKTHRRTFFCSNCQLFYKKGTAEKKWVVEDKKKKVNKKVNKAEEKKDDQAASVNKPGKKKIIKKL